MKVLHLAPTGNWAGTEEMVCRMANGLVDTHEVGVVMTTGDNIDERTLRSRFDPAVRVIIPQDDTTPGERAAQVVAEFGVPDLIHAHLRPGLEHAWPLRDLAPVIGHLHVRYFSSQFWWVDAVVCVSEWQSHDVPSSFDGPVYMIPNSIEQFDTAAPQEVAAIRRRVGAGEDSVVFGAVGRLSAEKGFDTLVRAFTAGAAEQDRLIIIGDGSTKERLEQLASSDERVHLLGYVPRARALLPAFDVYVSSSRLDSFGLSVLEAMAVGLPIVSTNARGPADLLESEPADIVPIDDIDALSTAMNRVAARVRAGQTSTAYDLERYRHETCAQQLVSVYAHLAAGGPVPGCLVRARSAGQAV